MIHGREAVSTAASRPFSFSVDREMGIVDD
jgi:hypothetical protein